MTGYTCSDCGEVKPDDAFYFHHAGKRTRKDCKECVRQRAKAWYYANTERARDKKREYHRLNRRKNNERRRQTVYGLTPDDWDAMVKHQHGLCAICWRAVPLCVDHDHDTGAVRGLLCARCNSGAGYFEDDPDLIRAAADYIETHLDVPTAPATGQAQAPGEHA